MYIRDPGKGQSMPPRPPKNYSGTAFRAGEPASPVEMISPLTGVIPATPVKEAEEAREERVREPIPRILPREEPSAPRVADDRDDSPTQNGVVPPGEAGGDADRDDGTAAGRAGKDAAKNPLRSLFSSIMPGIGRSGREEFGFEELLIVGLIFLLSQSEGESDILLLLALLLFYK